MQQRDAFHFVFKRRHRDRTCLEKDTNECSCLIGDSSCCRTSCVSVQPCTPKGLPNTETFLHSRVFFVTYVVPALCQIMYSLSVCSDGTTSAAPRSFRQNRPPARTLSLTSWLFSCADEVTCMKGLVTPYHKQRKTPAVEIKSDFILVMFLSHDGKHSTDITCPK